LRDSSRTLLKHNSEARERRRRNTASPAIALGQKRCTVPAGPQTEATRGFLLPRGEKTARAVFQKNDHLFEVFLGLLFHAGGDSSNLTAGFSGLQLPTGLGFTEAAMGLARTAGPWEERRGQKDHDPIKHVGEQALQDAKAGRVVPWGWMSKLNPLFIEGVISSGAGPASTQGWTRLSSFRVGQLADYGVRPRRP